MVGIGTIFAITVGLIVLYTIEAIRLRRNRAAIPIRIHVNGTRGKSSVTRLIAGGLREGGIETCAKSTGTLPCMSFPDGSEYPVFRPSGVSVIEQARIIGTAAAHQVKALVIECMALQPYLQWLCEERFVKATHAVVTNVREDHLDVMGPSEEHVAWSIAGMVPVGARLYLGDERHREIFEHVAAERGTEVYCVTEAEKAAVTDEEMNGFSYIEHRDNVALALRICGDLGVERKTALRGMWNAMPDAGVMSIYLVRFFGRHVYFATGFAANDPESTENLWNLAIERCPDVEKRIAIVNCRSDRPNRSEQLGEACARWTLADHYILIGTGTYFFARTALRAGIPLQKIINAEGQTDTQIFETIIELTNRSSLVMGMANIKGQGLDLIRYFRNRSIQKDVIR